MSQRFFHVLFILLIGIIGANTFTSCSGDDDKGDKGKGNSDGGGTLTGSDGGPYSVIEIGGVKWMDKNLNAETTNSWCYDDNPDNCNTYGRLYTWQAAENACKGLDGNWRLPTADDWTSLMEATSSFDQNEIATRLKSTSGWNAESGNGTDDLSFSVLPSGARSWKGVFYNIGLWAAYWGSAKASNVSIGESIGLGNADASQLDNVGYSVRCVKN